MTGDCSSCRRLFGWMQASAVSSSRRAIPHVRIFQTHSATRDNPSGLPCQHGHRRRKDANGPHRRHHGSDQVQRLRGRHAYIDGNGLRGHRLYFHRILAWSFGSLRCSAWSTNRVSPRGWVFSAAARVRLQNYLVVPVVSHLMGREPAIYPSYEQQSAEEMKKKPRHPPPAVQARSPGPSRSAVVLPFRSKTQD